MDPDMAQARLAGGGGWRDVLFCRVSISSNQSKQSTHSQSVHTPIFNTITRLCINTDTDLLASQAILTLGTDGKRPVMRSTFDHLLRLSSGVVSAIERD